MGQRIKLLKIKIIRYVTKIENFIKIFWNIQKYFVYLCYKLKIEHENINYSGIARHKRND